MDIKSKLRPFYVAKILYERTDENHYLTIVQIMEQLKKGYDISTSRGTVANDIKVLQEVGMEIEVEQSTQNRYYLIARKFDLPELKMLVDAVESARFIPKEKSAVLVEKLLSLSSKFEASKLIRNVDVENRIKSDNNKIYYIMDALNNAINKKRKVSFQYYTYNVNKEKVLRHDGEFYILSPYKLIWNGDYYYVVGYSEKHGNIGNFRVDRIVTTPVVLSEEAHEQPKSFNLNVYLNSMFRMYNSERKQVELVCENSVVEAIIDKFGKDIEVQVINTQTFSVVVSASVGHVFYSWIFGFGGKVSIKSPNDVKDEYIKMVEETAEVLKKVKTKQ
ncbi:helix-turn-helix transcriptional regulator [Ruminococcus sp.]|uniref:helix-turn-helix transcriptional regulator n=1 Tax=Ruminococcus sp. TaxID=41978 RepID=UPI00388F99DF